MVFRTLIVLIVLIGFAAVLNGPLIAAEPGSKEAAVPAEEYPVYDEVVRSKFLTSGTTLVVIERMTTTQMLPESQILPTATFFEERGFFDSRLPRDLILDFLFKNQRPARLGSLFGFGVPYRFISGDGRPEAEAKVHEAPSGRLVGLVQDAKSIDRLAFSRVGFSGRLDQALVYVSNDRPDGSGAGFLVWLRTEGTQWTILDTEVVWIARPEPRSADRP
ncbi:MAG TPA: hypothetical protein VHF07_07435 [Nitrospiraceae bacterium]|nr:hypothetical protein [Nitrospiraceae bacterium]